MKEGWKTAGAAALFLLLCLVPDAAREGARAALHAWATGVVPALLPFLAALPALSGGEAQGFYRATLGRIMPLFGLAPEMAGAVFVGLTGGSPAGAAALASLARERWLDRNQALRCAWLASGASLGFLLSVVPRSMLGDGRWGAVLVRGQLAGQLLAGLILRRAGRLPGRAACRKVGTRETGAIQGAVSALLTIGGCMAFFGALAQLGGALLGEWARTPLLAALELAGGCRSLAEEALPIPVKLALISACASLGGLSACVQCMAFLRPLGIRIRHYLPGKLLGAACCGLCTWLQACLPVGEEPQAVDPLVPGALMVSILLLAVCLYAPIYGWKEEDAETPAA